MEKNFYKKTFVNKPWPENILVNEINSNIKTIHIVDNVSTFSQEMLLSLLNLGATKYAIAKELKISRATLYRILNNASCNPNQKTFSKLLCLYCARCYESK